VDARLPPEENKTEQPPFERIVSAAITEDVAQLSEVLELVCIDVWNEDISGTPVTALARGGKVKAVNFLLERGASPVHAACGYGQAGDLENFRDLLKQVEEKRPGKLPPVLKQAAYGFALSLKPEKLAAFLKLIETEYPDQMPYLQSDLARGHAQRGNIEAAAKVLSFTRIKYPDRVEETAKAIAGGMALCGNVDGIKKFFSNEGGSFSQTIILCMARGGHFQKLTDFFWYKEISSLLTTHLLIARGLAQVGVEVSNSFSQEGAYGFALGGHKSKTDPLVFNFLPELAAGFAAGGHVDMAYDCFIEKSFKTGFNTFTDVDVLERIAKDFAENNNADDANLFLEKMRNDSVTDVFKNIKNITFMIGSLVGYFFDNGNKKEALDFFDKEPTEDVISRFLKIKKDSTKTKKGSTKIDFDDQWELLQKILNEYPHLIKKFLSGFFMSPFHSNVNYYPVILKMFLTLKVLSTAEDPDAEITVRMTSFLLSDDKTKVQSMMRQSEQLVVTLGFTTLGQLLAWDNPVIHGMLALENFPLKIALDVVGIVVEFLSIASQQDAHSLTRHAAAHGSRLFKETQTFDPLRLEESKATVVSVVAISARDLARILDTYKPSGFLGTKTDEIQKLCSLMLTQDGKIVNRLIDRSEIEEVLKDFPQRLALFNDPSKKAGNSDTDRIIVEIRDLYPPKNLQKGDQTVFHVGKPKGR